MYKFFLVLSIYHLNAQSAWSAELSAMNCKQLLDSQTANYSAQPDLRRTELGTLMAVRPYLDPTNTIPVDRSPGTTMIPPSQAPIYLDPQGMPLQKFPPIINNLATIHPPGARRIDQVVVATSTDGQVYFFNDSKQIAFQLESVTVGALRAFSNGRAAVFATHFNEETRIYKEQFILTSQRDNPLVFDLPGLSNRLHVGELPGDRLLVGTVSKNQPFYIVDAVGSAPRVYKLPKGVDNSQSGLKFDPSLIPATGQVILQFENQTAIIHPEDQIAPVLISQDTDAPTLQLAKSIVLVNSAHNYNSKTANNFSIYDTFGTPIATVKSMQGEQLLGVAKTENFSQEQLVGVYSHYDRANPEAQKHPLTLRIWNERGQEKSNFDLPTTFRYTTEENLEFYKQSSLGPISLANGKVVIPALTVFRYQDDKGKWAYKFFLQFFILDAFNSKYDKLESALTLEVSSPNLSYTSSVLALSDRRTIIRYKDASGVDRSLIVDSNDFKPLNRLDIGGFPLEVTSAGVDAKRNARYAFKTQFRDEITFVSAP